MPRTQRTFSPIDGSLYVERELADDAALGAVVERARRAQALWRRVPLEERCQLARQFVERFAAKRDDIALELTWQMGRPIRHSPFEVRGVVERATYMTDIAAQALSDVDVGPKPGFSRFIRHEPLGVVLVLAPWNYPYLTAVNALLPALVAGNAVVLKHSDQTPLCAERFAEALSEAGFPRDVFQVLHADHSAVAALISKGAVDYVAFTGSVAGGDAVSRAAATRRVGVGLELGGKDPAYVRADADFGAAVENLVDGAFFNAGQSCCGVERIYVATPLYERFVAAFVALTNDYRLGHPLDPEVTLGPLVRAGAADFVRGQIREAVALGAKALIDPKRFAADAPGTAYLAPQVLTGVSHDMRVMNEESFGPVVGIMPVDTDAAAVALMNDSRYGLTASLWTSDEQAALQIADQLATGTVFMNRCDYLDPALAWTGVKDSGRGCTLSRFGYAAFTRPKSFHFKRLEPRA
jgi:acyl-CoA reductase-like NAD-dependent aldehyde dehydrogenase